MRIVWVRHGETNENASRRYLGHFDAELNETGRQQLQSLTEKLNMILAGSITSVYSSDLSRAMESARIIGKQFQLNYLPVCSLRELNFGDWECKTYEEIMSDNQERLEMWVQNPYTVAPPNGETLLQLGERIDQWFDQILANKEQNETILIVSHGGPIRWFLSKWVMGDPKEFWNVEGAGHGKAIMIDFNEQTGMFTILNRL